jgi:hypothetical protein
LRRASQGARSVLLAAKFGVRQSAGADFLLINF